MDPDPAALWIGSHGGSSTGPLGAAAFIPLSLAVNIYKGGTEARPDGNLS